MKSTSSLGEESQGNFHVYDVVTWKKLGKKANIGMIYELYTIKMGGRQVKKAKIASFRNALNYDVLVLELKLVSKAK